MIKKNRIILPLFLKITQNYTTNHNNNQNITKFYILNSQFSNLIALINHYTVKPALVTTSIKQLPALCDLKFTFPVHFISFKLLFSDHRLM